MKLQEVATGYLSMYFDNGQLPGGLAYPKALEQLDMDGTVESLSRIDMLLDQIREKQRPAFEDFIKDVPNRNFLYLLCFYIATVISKNTGKGFKFESWDEFMADNPGAAAAWPKSFESNVVMNLQEPSGRIVQFLPLVPVVIRLFEGPEEKSVAFSAAAYL